MRTPSSDVTGDSASNLSPPPSALICGVVPQGSQDAIGVYPALIYCWPPFFSNAPTVDLTLVSPICLLPIYFKPLNPHDASKLHFAARKKEINS